MLTVARHAAQELSKVKRSLTKRLPSAPHETLLVLDGTTGLNMLNQAREFNQAVGLTGLILTKLDGSSKGARNSGRCAGRRPPCLCSLASAGCAGGAVVSVVDELGLPVKFVGVGEGIDDLQAFDPQSFAAALFDKGLKAE